MGKYVRPLVLLLWSYSLVGCSRFKSDMEDVCHAVERSGVENVRSQEDLVTALLWAKERVRTNEGSAFWRNFESAYSHDQYYFLRTNTWEAGIENCPLEHELRAMPLPRLITLERWPNRSAPASQPQDSGSQTAKGKPDAGV